MDIIKEILEDLKNVTLEELLDDPHLDVMKKQKSIKYYVTMTDKFMSGWGMAKNKINKLVIECETYKEAEIVERNALNRSDMKNVNVRSTRPYYNQNHYFVSWHDKNDYQNFFKPGAF